MSDQFPEYEDEAISGLDPDDAIVVDPDPDSDVDHEPNPDAGEYS